MRLNVVRSLAIYVVFALGGGLAFLPDAQAQYYVSGYGGGIFTDDANTPISAVGITVGGEAEFDPGFVVGGAIGYRWQEFRLEGEVSYRIQDVSSYTATSVSGAGFGTITGVANTPLSDTDTSALAVMINGWYDVRTRTPWRPYIGGGLGMAITTLNIGSADTGSNEFDDSDTVFAFQAGVGLDYEINPAVRGRVGYRFFGTLGPNYTDTVGGTRFDIESDISSHTFLASVMFKM